jgi:hypothetical protein
LLIIVLFSCLFITFTAAQKIKRPKQTLAGMEKETAHQIGTPLSSLIGWVEILKNVDESTTIEIEKILSLQTITDRFSIGSEPILEKRQKETLQSYTYLQSRFSKNNIEFTLKVQNHLFLLCLIPPYTAGPLKPCQECY